MKKAVKRIGLVLGLLLVILVVGVWVLFIYLDQIVAGTVEKQGTASMNLKTELGSAKLSVLGGTLGLNELQIASPQGFSAPHMLSLGKANVAVSYGQLRGDPVHVASITLDQPTLVIEQANGSLNFKKAFDAMPAGDPKPADSSKSLKMIIDELTVKDAKVIMRPGIPGLPQEIPISVATFTLKNVGTGDGAQNGAGVKDVAMQVITALAAQANTSKLIPPELQAILNGDLSAVMNKFGAEAQKRVLQAVPGEAGQMLAKVIADPTALTKDPGKALQGIAGDALKGKLPLPTSGPSLDAAKTASDALGGLLGGDKKKDGKSAGSDATKKASDALGGLLGGDKKKDK